MTEFFQILGALREQMRATLSWTDVLPALIWPMSALMLVTLGLVYAQAPQWLLITFATMFVLVVNFPGKLTVLEQVPIKSP